MKKVNHVLLKNNKVIFETTNELIFNTRIRKAVAHELKSEVTVNEARLFLVEVKGYDIVED